MFSAEDGAMEIIEQAIEKYELHFGKVFPLYEYTEMTRSDDNDFSVVGGEMLSKFIDTCIKNEDPVNVPEGYEERLY